MDGWLTFADPRFEVRLSYPSGTQAGEPVARSESEVGNARRVLIRSADREVYVEITRYPLISANEEHRSHTSYLETRFGKGAVTPLTEALIASRPAQKYSFAWPEGERTVVLLNTTNATYRVIWNSASALNHQILETLEVHESNPAEVRPM